MTNFNLQYNKRDLAKFIKKALNEDNGHGHNRGHNRGHNAPTPPQKVQKMPPVDYNSVSLENDPKVRNGQEWVKYGGNFPIKRGDRIFYVSRSMTVSLYTFCKDSNGEWCVLANQRGDSKLWNIPAGYLDYNETKPWAAKRECWEETGVNVPMAKIREMGTNSGTPETDDDIANRKPMPARGRQDVSTRYAAVLDGTIDDYPVSDEHCEPGEVLDIQWIPLSQLDKYNWAYGQGKKILGQANTSLGDWKNGNGGDNSIKSKILRLRYMIGNNMEAQNLLKEIIKELSNPTV